MHERHMFNALIGLTALLGGVLTQTQVIMDAAQRLPARPAQSLISCHDAVWEQTNLTTVSSIKIDTKLAPFIKQAVTDARNSNLLLEINSGYRTCAQQQNLRISACGIGDYNLYQKPIELCAPPTEPAGKSLHNEGLAIDFKCGGYSTFANSPCLKWLRVNGYKYHLSEHYLEPWHWSTTGQ